MDNKEAILRIVDHMEVHGIGTGCHIKIAEALRMAIKALESQPLHIDREKWEPCKECNEKTCENCDFLVTESWEAPCKNCINRSCWKPLNKFCPECGRPLTDEAWAEMQKRLEGMMDA